MSLGNWSWEQRHVAYVALLLATGGIDVAELNEGRAVEFYQWARSKGLAVGVCTCSVPNRESTCYLYVDYTTMAVTLVSHMPPVGGVEFSWEEREAAYVALVIAG